MPTPFPIPPSPSRRLAAIRDRQRLLVLAGCAALSASVHLSLVLLMLSGPRQEATAPATNAPQPTLEFRLVQYEGAAPDARPPSSQTPSARPAAPTMPTPPIQEPPPDEAAEAAVPPPALPSPIAPPQTAAAPPTPTINLGGTDSLSSLIATGDRIIPPAIDSKIHNREPVYPREAVRLGQQGAVTLLVHVAPDGTALSVEIPETSGFQMLDAAARTAVASWHFQPAIQGGLAVTSEFPVRIQFQLH